VEKSHRIISPFSEAETAYLKSGLTLMLQGRLECPVYF
jgi:hypothetical protein